MIWKTRRHTINLSHRGVVMGILNATPDSFSDGGRHHHHRSALAYALQMVADGAEIIDVGGESTRPGALKVGAQDEIARVVPLISALRSESDVLISIDTSKATVAEAALAAGADVVNDVTGLTGPESGDAMVDICGEFSAGVVVMHMQGDPQTMQRNPHYHEGVTAVVSDYFHERLEYLTQRGISRDRLCFDPGIGFGKTFGHNAELLKNLGVIQNEIARPLLLGVSRKSMIGTLTGEQLPENRDLGTAVITGLAAQLGVGLHRVHEVAGNLQALRLVEGLQGVKS